MSNNAEYDKLVNDKENAQLQYNSCENRIENYEYRLRRLRNAKEHITELKIAFKTNKKSDKSMKNEKRDWTGSTNNSFKQEMTSLIDANEDYYSNSIDRILDSLNNEITRIENIRMEEYGLLGQLGSWINSLANRIENFFN